ncbi:MAG: hypothetical protein DWH97_01490 [Planctomycetota bacterium]|nr:MAG: hypothetical protein DWH97_01490 [Planctomycetota bacterium]RLS96762.1 MAG: hypothetical protein DWI12_01660 [Planctomycetota bacterium]
MIVSGNPSETRLDVRAATDGFAQCFDRDCAAREIEGEATRKFKRRAHATERTKRTAGCAANARH